MHLKEVLYVKAQIKDYVAGPMDRNNNHFYFQNNTQNEKKALHSILANHFLTCYFAH